MPPTTTTTATAVSTKDSGGGGGMKDSSNAKKSNTVKPKTAPAKLTRKTPKDGEKKSVRIAMAHKSATDLYKPSPLQTRSQLKDTYEEPFSGREDWWRATMKETPVPGAYEHDDFLKDLDKRPHSYRFKSDGRKTDPYPYGKGSVLLPGAYDHEDLVQRLERYNTTYGFKGSSRNDRDFLNFGVKDAEINISPNAYNTEKYLTLTVEKQPSKHWVFKSQSQRFPTIHFRPREGPGPGSYPMTRSASNLIISSSFKSKTPRFKSSHSKVPGPGMYEKTFQSPMPGTIVKMGRQHGLFFSSAFQV